MRNILLAIAVLLSAQGPAAAQIDSAPKVEARLIADTDEIAPGGTVSVALEQNIRPGWHTYWFNPGEAGLPTEVKWSLPKGWRAGAIEWPYPKRLPVGPLMNYGYEGKVWLLTKLTAPRDAKPGDVVNLKAAASWLVCQEVCIPEDRTLTLPLTVTVSPTAPYATVAEQFAAARAKIPSASPWPATFHLGDTLDLFLASPALAKAQLKGAAWFPLAGGAIVDFAPQTFGSASGGLVLHLKPAKKPKIGNALSGIVVLSSADGSVQALTVSARPGAVPSAGEGTGNAVEISLALALLFALLGGVILNLMPCVLPILAMKALAIANTAHGDRREAIVESFAYGIGAVLSFAALGLALILLRASGEAIGWGFQLQSPIAVAGFALLVFVVALNLSGVFEVPGVGVGEGLTRRGGPVGAFFTGVLAVAVAAPCTAPFMAAALGYALTQSAAVALLVFVALGIGFAAPFVLIGLSPCGFALAAETRGVDAALPAVPGVSHVRHCAVAFVGVEFPGWHIRRDPTACRRAVGRVRAVDLRQHAGRRHSRACAGMARAHRRRDCGVAVAGADRRRRARGARNRRHRIDSIAALQRSLADSVAVAASPRVRERDGRVVHHLSGQRESGVLQQRGARCLRKQAHRLPRRRLDQSQPRDQRTAAGAWPLRRAAVSVLCAQRDRPHRAAAGSHAGRSAEDDRLVTACLLRPAVEVRTAVAGEPVKRQGNFRLPGIS